MKTRERYWGLYMYGVGKDPDSGWLLFEGSESGMRTYGLPSKNNPRKRFGTCSDAASWHGMKGLGPHVAVRPFYVTRRPRSLPAEAQAVIDAAKQFNDGKTGWATVMDALRAYEATK